MTAKVSLDFHPARLIEKKRNGEALSREEITWWIDSVTQEKIPEYQTTALLMAIYFQGMSPDETMWLTEAMLKSGDRYEWRQIPGVKSDKHSTGGVGDKVSIILAPLAAACGLIVPMMAGRGLGHSGGTLDKLESIPGFRVELTKAAFKSALEKVGCAIIGQSQSIAPADKKLYALRDVTGTVECIPLIVGSILSKKLAEGTETLVMDVKFGNGAFMQTKDQAKKLSRALIQVGKKMGIKIRCLLTNMDQPLGQTAGNSLEILECIELMRPESGHTLRVAGLDGKSTDLREVTLALTAHMLHVSGVVRTLSAGRKLALEKLQDGSAFRKFGEMIAAQGGDTAVLAAGNTLLPISDKRMFWKSAKRGFLTHMDTTELGRILVDLGGGRRVASDRIDPSVGMRFLKKLGSQVQSGESLVEVFLPLDFPPSKIEELRARYLRAITIQPTRKTAPKLLGEVLS
jgi:pyrimidine-nucleoside phosphorylase